MVAISTNVKFSFALLSKLVSNASTVSKLVKQLTPVSIDVLLIKKPSRFLSRPCVGVSITISILCSRS